MPAILSRKKTLVLIFVALVFFYLWSPVPNNGVYSGSRFGKPFGKGAPPPQRISRWSRLRLKYAVPSMRPLPTGQPQELPKVQKDFGPESESEREVRLTRQSAVQEAFERCWTSYRENAWMSDELAPLSGGRRDPFGGWGATLVDSLDTLWIMGMKDEFNAAVAAASQINFETTRLNDINVFETNIRYLGGFLSAYDLSGDERLLSKAREVGDMLYIAFDTPNRMPITRWNLHAAGNGDYQQAHDNVLLAEIGSFSLEFIRLSLITGDPKWFDAVQRVMEVFQIQQHNTLLPGMWPVVVNARTQRFDQHSDYTLGAMADSLYEYLPKTHALVGGLLPMYEKMYRESMDTAIRHNLFRPMLPDGKDVLLSGLVKVSKQGDGTFTTKLRPEGQHLVCFAGGMLALGGKLIQNNTHVEKGEKITDGCVWTYQNMPLGIMPEVFYMLPCESTEGDCPWEEEKWLKAVQNHASGKESDDVDVEAARKYAASKNLPKGFTYIQDTRYILRPEAIESVFILYRITGRKDLLETAWKMFVAIDSNTRTDLANAALSDVTVDSNPPKSDSMESFWLGETLKYFYLIFSEPDLISLDEYVFNTEAHPLKRLLPSRSA